MRKYLIVGGSSGIGNALVEHLHADGAHVFATYNATETASRPMLDFAKYDVLEDDLDQDFLPDTLDGLVYCPGSIKLMPFERIKTDQYLQDFRLQVEGAIKTIQQVLPRLKKSANASIVLFSTVAVQQGFNFHSQVAVSKGAIEGLTKALAAELAPSIRVNAIAPSITDTPLAHNYLNTEEKVKANADRHPLKRIGKPEDISEVANFLLSEKSSWITSQILHIDGGMSYIKT